MTLPSLQQIERQSLCELMLDYGPTAPTLCGDWNTTDLVIHLYVRERKPLAAPGILLGGPFASVLHRTTERLSQLPFPELVEAVRKGPPAPLRPFDRVVNLLEYYIHHEDVRRGAGDNSPRVAAETERLDDALWNLLGRIGRLLTRSSRPIGLRMIWTDEAREREHVVRPGQPWATLAGRPGELALYLTGRKTAAQVELSGSAAAMEALRTAPFGI